MNEKEKDEYIAILENLLKERDKLLRAIPECPEHGQCVPHAIEWVEKMKAKELEK